MELSSKANADYGYEFIDEWYYMASFNKKTRAIRSKIVY